MYELPPRIRSWQTVDRYRADDWGNGYLLVVTDGKDNYLSSLTGMPQTKGCSPFQSTNR